MITIICCYNDPIQLQEMLIASLNLQSVSCNRIFIDTQKYGFKSAAQAFNAVLSTPDKYDVMLTEQLLFAHQDIYFKDPDVLTRIEALLTESPKDIFGFAGMTKQRKVPSNLKYKSTDSFITKTQLVNITEVESVDECCFSVNRTVWRQLHFDEVVCNHWHLYAVELCYNARLKLASKIYVLPFEVYHKFDLSEGLYTDNKFISSYWKLLKKYRRHFDTIYAPCYILTTFLPYAALRLTRTRLRNIFKK